MRTVHLPYGLAGLDVDVPDSATVVEPDDPPALRDEQGAVSSALRSPDGGPPLEVLVEQAQRGRAQRDRAQKIVVVFPDITRPMPNTTVLPPLLSELERLGVGPEQRRAALRDGDPQGCEPPPRCPLSSVQTSSPATGCTTTAATERRARCGRAGRRNRGAHRPRYVEADLRIVTGFVEPHFFAGFSGGPKAVCPGLADLDTILEAHSRRRISEPLATWTVMNGNPVHEFVRQAVDLAPPHLSLDVTIDRERRLTGGFCGPLPGAHLAACESVLHTSVSCVEGPFEVVVTTNGGHPLDRNLYQAVKGMAAAERVVAPGGTIVIAAGMCRRAAGRWSVRAASRRGGRCRRTARRSYGRRKRHVAGAGRTRRPRIGRSARRTGRAGRLAGPGPRKGPR